DANHSHRNRRAALQNSLIDEPLTVIFFLSTINNQLLKANMIRNKFIAFIATCCACFAAASLNAATIPAGTVLNVKTASSISSQDPAGRTFAAQLDQDVAVKGQVLLKA